MEICSMLVFNKSEYAMWQQHITATINGGGDGGVQQVVCV
jgi:restriction endonuclease Mrr